MLVTIYMRHSHAYSLHFADLRFDLGGNLAAMLYLYQQTKPMVYRRIVSTVRKVMPMLNDFVLEPQRIGDEARIARHADQVVARFLLAELAGTRKA